jgi:hypothetical protein
MQGRGKQMRIDPDTWDMYLESPRGYEFRSTAPQANRTDLFP